MMATVMQAIATSWMVQPSGKPIRLSMADALYWMMLATLTVGVTSAVLDSLVCVYSRVPKGV